MPKTSSLTVNQPSHERRSSVQTAPVPEMHDAVLSVDLNMSDDYSVSRR